MVFPNNLLHFEVGREKSIAAVEWAVSNNSDVFLVAQKEMKVEDPKRRPLYLRRRGRGQAGDAGVGRLVRILVEGKYRARLSEMEDDGSFLLVTVRPAPGQDGEARGAAGGGRPRPQRQKRALTTCWL